MKQSLWLLYPLLKYPSFFDMIIAFAGLKTLSAAYWKSLLIIETMLSVSPSNVCSHRVATPMQFSYELPMVSYRTRLYLRVWLFDLRASYSAPLMRSPARALRDYSLVVEPSHSPFCAWLLITISKSASVISNTYWYVSE